MKKLLSIILFSLLVTTVFAQNISGPKPIISAYSSASGDWVDFHNFPLELGCGVQNFQVKAEWTDIGSPDSYRVEAIPYKPKQYLRTMGNTVLDPSVGFKLSTLPDDQWSPAIPLSSNGSDLDFCYFGNQRNEFVISSNGILSFDTTYANNYSSWTVHTMGKIEPNANCGDGASGNNDSILQFHDTYPTHSDAEFDSYQFWDILGAPGERYFIMGTHNMPMYSNDCGSDFGSATHQMVFYETTNIIEFHIQDKPLCDVWANGMAAFGLQNEDSTVGLAVPGMDNLTPFQILEYTVDTNGDSIPDEPAVHNPAIGYSNSTSYRFIPDGNLGVDPVFGWYLDWTGDPATSTFVSDNPILSVDADDIPIPPASLTYTAVVTYVEYCSGNTYHATQDVTFVIDDPIIMHIKEQNSADDTVELIDKESIQLCEGEDHLIETIIQNWDPTDGVNFTAVWTISQFGEPDITDAGNVDASNNYSYQITNAQAGTYTYTFTIEHGTCSFSDSVEVRVFDSTTTMNYPAPKVFCASDDDANATPQNVFPTPTTTPDEEYYYTIDNGGVWLNPLASDPTHSLDGIPDLSASLANAITTLADGSAEFTITYKAHCPGNTVTDIITIRTAPLVRDPSGIPELSLCETNNIHTAVFDITAIETYIANGIDLADLNFEWVSATGGVVFNDPIDDPLTTTTVDVVLTITSLNDVAACEVVYNFTLQVHTNPSIGTPVNNLELCENDATPGIATFNGTNIESTILAGQDPANYTVTYSGVDTNGDAVTITSPLPANFNASSMTITASVVNNSSNCTSADITFDLIVRTIPIVQIPNSGLELCETDTTNHTAEFDTSTWDDDILAGNSTPINTDFIIEYDYIDSSGTPIFGANSIPNPFTSASQTVTVRARNVTSGEQTCSSGDQTFNLIVNPKPVETPQTPIVICSKDITNINLDDYTTLTNNTYTWIATDNPNVTGETIATNTNSLITDTLNNVSLTDQVVIYTITPTASNGCVGDDFTINVTVDPQPVSNSPTPFLICSGNTSSVDLNTLTSLVGNTYSWVVTNNPNVTGETTGIQSSNMISETLTNTSSSNQDVIYTVTPTSIDGCVGDDFDVIINVGVEPTGTDPNVTTCSGLALAIDLDAATTLTGNTFSWTVANNTNVTGETTGTSTNGIITDTLINESGVDQIVTYTVTPTSANGCLGSNFNVTVTVKPEPVFPTTTLEIACSDVALNISLDALAVNSLTGTTYSWVTSNNANVTIVPDSSVPNTLTDTITNISGSAQDVIYTITPTSANGCIGEDFDIVVTIGDEPVGTNQTPLICSDDSVGIDLDTIINKAGTTYTWTATDNPNITGETLTGTSNLINDILNNVSGVNQDVIYTITPTNGCVGDDFTITVTVKPEPVGTTPSNINACSDVEFTINLDNHTSLTGNTYTWIAVDAGNNVTGETNVLTTGSVITETITNTSNSAQTVDYQITPTSADGCQGDLFIISVDVGVEPTELATTPILVPFCSTDPLNIDLNTFTTLTGNTYKWIATDNIDANVTGESLTEQSGSSITDIIINKTDALQTVTYTITPISAQGCEGNAFDIVVEINPEPIADNVEEPACSDVEFVLNLNSYITNLTTNDNTFTWVATDNPNVTGETLTITSTNEIRETLTNVSLESQDVVYTVTPTSVNGCEGNSFEVKVTVGVEPVGADQTPPKICSGDTLGLELNSYITNLTSNDNTFSWYTDINNQVTGMTTVTDANPETIITDELINTSGVIQTVIYHVTPYSAAPNNCAGDEFTVTVEVGFAPIGTETTETMCNDETLALNLDNYTTLANNTYTWSAIENNNVTGETTSNMSTSVIEDKIINISGTMQTVEYIIIPVSEVDSVTGEGGCIGEAFSVFVEVNPRPDFVLNAQYFICPEDGTATIGEITNPNNYTYQWFEHNDLNTEIGDNDAEDRTLEVSEGDLVSSGGTYVLKVTDPITGCQYIQFTSVSMADQMAIAEVHVSDFNRPNNTITIDVVGGSGDFEYTLTYIDNYGTTQTITQNSNVFNNVVASEDSMYIEVRDKTACSITIVSDEIYVLDYPPFFTPNGDSYNDTWQITGVNFIPESKIYIFDRFGKVLAEIDPESIGWNGIYNGKQLPATDYWFTVQYLDPNTNLAKTANGHFSIIRK